MFSYSKRYSLRTLGIIALLAMTITGFSQTSYAIDLATARATGLVGETDKGYLAIPPGAKPSAETQTLINNVNAVRKADFTAQSKKSGVDIELVGIRMFQIKIYPSLSPGTWVKIQGNWTRKE